MLLSLSLSLSLYNFSKFSKNIYFFLLVIEVACGRRGRGREGTKMAIDWCCFRFEYACIYAKVRERERANQIDTQCFKCQVDEHSSNSGSSSEREKDKVSQKKLMGN